MPILIRVPLVAGEVARLLGNENTALEAEIQAIDVRCWFSYWRLCFMLNVILFRPR